MLDSASDRKSIRRREKAARLAERQRAEVLTSVMSTPAGREWIWNILGACHCFSTTFTSDALVTAFQEGQRSTGLGLLADILQTCPDQYIAAMRESAQRAIAVEARTEDPDAESDPDEPAEK